jgi:type II secretion system protein G
MTSPSMVFKTNAGFTLIEILMVIAILAVITIMSLVPISNTIDESRFQETVQKMQMIRNAMLGDPTISENGVRTSFGFLGDIGAIPTAGQGIAALITNPGLTAWSLNAAKRLAGGWNGPYLTSAQAGSNFSNDAWGRAFIYSPAASPPTLVSYGADGVAGGTGFNQDITVQLPTNMQTAKVYGFVSIAAKPYSGDAQIEINYPDGTGALTTSTVTIVTADKGSFSFLGIPLGKRSVTVYMPNKAGATQTLGPALITVDSNQYVIPATVLDTNSAGGSACNNLGIVTLAGGISLGGGNTILNFNVNISTNIELQQIAVTDSAATTWNRFKVGLADFICTGASTLYTCPTPDDGTLSTLTPGPVSSGAALPISIYFAGSIGGSGTATVQFNYNLGCDQVLVTGL